MRGIGAGPKSRLTSRQHVQEVSSSSCSQQSGSSPNPARRRSSRLGCESDRPNIAVAHQAPDVHLRRTMAVAAIVDLILMLFAAKMAIGERQEAPETSSNPARRYPATAFEAMAGLGGVGSRLAFETSRPALALVKGRSNAAPSGGALPWFFLHLVCSRSAGKATSGHR
jgi:hypothetical protein